ncbi:alpha-2B adrenergic receptor-like [Paramacrobiotus metropolitanus]|uniref:alpha-2B adrenergic receptor-like n=1 Tax=Paramacrobiotus metropolitanus TaxID=2943436 RepID=UPI002445DE55|nr:alpha-2B adrenergic receptor-like [Paramacrobiotus metropolitanus]
MMYIPPEMLNTTVQRNDSGPQNQSNSSIPIPIVARWTVLPALEVIICISGLIGNSLVLGIFIKRGMLKQPFHIYLGNLLTANIIWLIFQIPLDVTNQIYPVWFLGNAACAIYQYAINVPGGVTTNTHLLIALNRIWAVQSPLTYAHHHSRSFALGACIVVWILAYGMGVPGIVLHAYNTPDYPDNCQLSTAPAVSQWLLTIQIIIYDIPNVLMLAFYPFLVWKRQQRNRIRQQRKAPTNTSINAIAQPSSVGTTAAPSDKKTGRSSENYKGFILLTFLTAGVMLCWTPCNVIYTAGGFIDVSTWTLSTQISLFLFDLLPVVDPIMFALIFLTNKTGGSE